MCAESGCLWCCCFISNGSGIVYHKYVLGTPQGRFLLTWAASHRHTLTQELFVLSWSRAICLVVVSPRRLSALQQSAWVVLKIDIAMPSLPLGCFLKAKTFTACSFSLSSSNIMFIGQVLPNRYMFHNHQVEIQKRWSRIHQLLFHQFHPTISDRSHQSHPVKLTKQRKDWNVDWHSSPDQPRSWKLILSLLT